MSLYACWGCGRVTHHGGVSDPPNPSDRSTPLGWFSYDIRTPESFWRVRAFGCSEDCLAIVKGLLAPFAVHVEALGGALRSLRVQDPGVLGGLMTEALQRAARAGQAAMGKGLVGR